MHAYGTMLLLIMTLGTGGADAEVDMVQAGTVEQLTRLVRPGDVVKVTQCSGAKVSGRVADVSHGSIVLVSSSARHTIATGEISRVKVLRRAQPRLADSTADAGATCQDPLCMGVALTFGGANAIGRGLGKLFGTGKTVYRAPIPGECGTARD